MSRDLLNLPHLAEKLRKMQGDLAAGVKPGSAPHPRRTLKDAAQVNNGNKTQKPRNPRRRKKRAPAQHERSVHEGAINGETGEALRPGGQDGDAASDSVLEDEEGRIDAK